MICRQIISAKHQIKYQIVFQNRLKLFPRPYLRTIAHFHSPKPYTFPKFSSIFNNLKQSAKRFSWQIVYYEEIIDLPNHPEKILIDVREPTEVKMGKIPRSVNIPLEDIKNALGMDCSGEDFQKKYGRSKPKPDTYIIVHCRCGVRSAEAAEILLGLGYKNVHNYCGSWQDYVKNKLK